MTANENLSSLVDASQQLESVLQQRFTQELAAFLAGCPHPAYALIEQALCDADVLDALAEQHQLDKYDLFIGTPEGHSVELGPCLIRLPVPLPPALAEALVREAALPHALSVLVSDWALSRLLPHFKTCFNGEMFDGSPVLVRYYDSRVSFAALDYWPEAARRHFLAPFVVWWAWDRDGEPGWRERELARSAASDAAAWPLQVSRELADDYARLSRIDSLIDPCLDEPAVAALSPWLRYRVVRDAVTAIEAYGPISWAGQIIVARTALVVHPYFYHSQALKSALEARPENEDRFEAAFSSLRESTVQAWLDQHESGLIGACQDLTARHQKALSRLGGRL